MRSSSFVIFSALVPFFSVSYASVTIRIPKQVRVTVDRFEDANGKARVNREFAIGFYEKPLDDKDYYRTVECGVVDLDVRVVHRCDCRTTTATKSNRDDGFSPSGTTIDVSYNLFLYVDDDDRRATYFSATVDGDVVVRREGGSASVPGEWFNRHRGLFGPNRPREAETRPPTTGDERRPSARSRMTRDGGGMAREDKPAVVAEKIDAIDERAFLEWLRREFTDDRVFQAAAAADAGGNVGRPTSTTGRDPACVELPEPKGTDDFRDLLPATGCYRVFSDRRCTGVSKMFFWRAESLNEDGILTSTTVDHESPSFRVESVAGCCRPRRERPLDGGDSEELVWSTSFSVDGDYSRSQDNGPDECGCGSLESTTVEPSADVVLESPASTVAPASSSSDSAVPSIGMDILTEANVDVLTDSSTENDKTKNKIPTKSSSSNTTDNSIRAAPVSLSSDSVTPLQTGNDILDVPSTKPPADNFVEPSAIAERKNEIPTESTWSDSVKSLKASNDILAEPSTENLADNFVEPSAIAERKNEIPIESSSSAIADDSVRAAPASLWNDSVKPLQASNDILAEPSTEPLADNLVEPSANAKRKNEIPTESSSSSIADDSTTISTLESSKSTISEPTTNTVMPEPSTTTASVSTIVRSHVVSSEKSDESPDNSDATGSEENETITVSTFGDEAKEAVNQAWNFLTSFAQKLLTSALYAYNTVQHAW